MISLSQVASFLKEKDYFHIYLHQLQTNYIIMHIRKVVNYIFYFQLIYVSLAYNLNTKDSSY